MWNFILTSLYSCIVATIIIAQCIKIYTDEDCGPMQKGQSEKVVKYRWWPRNGCDGRLVAKSLITIKVNLVPISYNALSYCALYKLWRKLSSFIKACAGLCKILLLSITHSCMQKCQPKKLLGMLMGAYCSSL